MLHAGHFQNVFSTQLLEMSAAKTDTNVRRPQDMRLSVYKGLGIRQQESCHDYDAAQPNRLQQLLMLTCPKGFEGSTLMLWMYPVECQQRLQIIFWTLSEEQARREFGKEWLLEHGATPCPSALGSKDAMTSTSQTQLGKLCIVLAY